MQRQLPKSQIILFQPPRDLRANHVCGWAGFRYAVTTGLITTFVASDVMDYLHIFFYEGYDFDEATKAKMGENLRQHADSYQTQMANNNTQSVSTYTESDRYWCYKYA